MRKRMLHPLLLAVIVAAGVLVPAATAGADERREQRGNIYIAKDSEFTKKNGVRSGSGTKSDPYIISNWDVSDVHIHDTSAHVVFMDNTIDWLTLNWIGPGVHVMDNYIGDLRVNENVERTGDATSGHFSNNTIGVVGQLRHFDGDFVRNLVGTPSNAESNGTMGFFFGDHRAVNFDGFNGATFAHNTIYGYVDVRLHGHHHGSDFGESSHYHGSSMSHDKMDHTKRFHQVWITDNKIHSAHNWALRYYDVAHSANDRTAASEDNEELNKPHIHHTRVYMTDNTLVGSGISVDIFNADDSRHTATAPGRVLISNNKITLAPEEQTDLWAYRNGIDVYNATDIKLDIVNNTIQGAPKEEGAVSDLTSGWNQTAGIYLYDVHKGDINIQDNVVSNRHFGVYASQFTKSVWWRVSNLKASGVEQELYYDQSVANKPNEGSRSK